jgi:hypothetical protein
MSPLYPRERVEAVLKPLSLTSAYRIVWKPYLRDPLGVRSAKSRFCDGRSFAVLYAAGDFLTAFAEVVVRDRFVGRDQRVVPYGDVAERGWLELVLAGTQPLNVVDLREAGCLALGAPTDAAHARNQSAGRALACALYDQYADIDGIRYPSRLTGGDCLAIFDRSLSRVLVKRSGELQHHPDLPRALATHRIALEA